MPHDILYIHVFYIVGVYNKKIGDIFMDKKLLKKIGASVLLVTINSGYTSFAAENSNVSVEQGMDPVVVESPIVYEKPTGNEKTSQNDVETSSVSNSETVDTVSDNTTNSTDTVINSEEKNDVQNEMPPALSNSEENVSSDSPSAPPVENVETNQKSENESPAPTSENSSDVFKVLSSPEFISRSFESALEGWKSVEQSFRNQKWETVEKLVNEFGFNYEKLSRNIENYSKYVNNFFNKNHHWDELRINRVSIFKNDSVSKDIQHNLNLLNYSKKFELINESIKNYKDVQYYLKDDNKELIKSIRKGLKIYFDSPANESAIDNLSDEQIASWWVISFLSYMNGAFNFYDNMVQSKVPFDQFKSILKFEFDYINKSTKSIVPLNKAVTFVYNYALYDINRKLEQKSESSDVKPVKEEQTINDNNKVKEFSYSCLSIDLE